MSFAMEWGNVGAGSVSWGNDVAPVATTSISNGYSTGNFSQAIQQGKHFLRTAKMKFNVW